MACTECKLLTYPVPQLGPVNHRNSVDIRSGIVHGISFHLQNLHSQKQYLFHYWDLWIMSYHHIINPKKCLLYCFLYGIFTFCHGMHCGLINTVKSTHYTAFLSLSYDFYFSCSEKLLHFLISLLSCSTAVTPSSFVFFGRSHNHTPQKVTNITYHQYQLRRRR